MANRYPNAPISQLWQVPLLILAVGLFAYAAWLLLEPPPGPTFEQQVELVERLLEAERPQAAIERTNRLLLNAQLDDSQQATLHLLLAKAIHLGQSQMRLPVIANYQQIIEQTRRAVAKGAILDAQAYVRLAESYDKLGRSVEALANYRTAIAIDTERQIAVRRRVIELLLDSGDRTSADAELQSYLADERLSVAERAWATGRVARLLADDGQAAAARDMMERSLLLVADPAARADHVAIAQVHLDLAQVELKLEMIDSAERNLRYARELLGPAHALDADASYFLGRIAQQRGQLSEAISFYDGILLSHPDSRHATPARAARGQARVELGQVDSGLADLHDATLEVNRRATRSVHRPTVIESLRAAQQSLSRRENFVAVLELLGYERDLLGDPPGLFFAKLGSTYESRARQIERAIADAPPDQRTRLGEQTRDARVRAADAYVAYAQKLSIEDNRGYAEALWQGINLYDRAGDVRAIIAVLEMFTRERPDDPMTPDALLRLGLAYQAVGELDQAIAAFQTNQLRHPNTLAASKSGVPLAQTLIAKGPEFYRRAENVLLSVVDNNPLITPDADEFRQGLFELGNLLYRTDRFEQAVGRFEEFVERYDDDPRVGRLLFVMAESYRMSAGALEVRLASTADASGRGSTTPAVLDASMINQARVERLTRAHELFDRVIAHFRDRPSTDPADQLYLKLSFLYRADCLFDIGQYDRAIELYDAAAFRYQNDPAALAAHVQIVNAYRAMGRLDEARAANERARWLLRRLPPESFQDGTFPLPREQWEQWLEWSAEGALR